METRTKTQLAAWTAVITLLPGHSSAQVQIPVKQPPIKVVLNGKPVAFSGTPPQQVKGSTLVPMRGIFEALGATVKFDKASQTVYGQKGATAIILPLGALTATVNGQPQTLPVPAELVNGTTLVPLRFISESLGASVAWNPTSSTVTIQTVDQHVAALPVVPGNTTISGEVTGLFTNTTPSQLTVRVGGNNTTIPLASTTIILRSVSDKAAMEVPLSNIVTGDQVTVQRGDNGVATVITATFGQVKGTIVSIGHLPNGSTTLKLDSGRVVELAANTPITFEGASVSLSDIKPYEVVVIRTNPANNLGYGVAVSTATDPNPTPPGAALSTTAVPAKDPNAGVLTGNVSDVEVTSFTDDALKPLRVGSVLRATLSGTPGGTAAFAIPGVVNAAPMREASPGVYVGSYIVGRGIAAHGAAVLGRLVAGGVQSALVQAPGKLTIDTQPPKITDFGPAQGAVVESDRPLLYATFSDGPGSGVNLSAIRITVDGQNVTASAETADTLFTYRPTAALAGGNHTVAIAVSDNAGNTTSASWSFQVAASKLVQSFVTNEPSGKVVGPASTILFVLNAAPGGKARVSVGNLLKNLPLKEGEPGVYAGEYSVKAGDNVEKAPVTARFTSRDGTTVSQNLATKLSVSAGPPPAPKIARFGENGYVDGSEPLTIKGRGVPNSMVRVTLSYTSKASGGILPVEGQIETRDVGVDKDGDWEADDLPVQTKPVFGTSRDTVYTISATQIDSAGRASSDPATVQVRPG